MRLVFFGTSSFAVPALRALAPNVLLVVSQPDRPSGRGLKLTPSPVKQAALELGIPVLTPEKARDPDFINHINSLDADVLVVAAYGQILRESLLSAAKNGGINLHGSILPQYRGAAPIQRCIENGDQVTGVTLMQMDKGMDTGDIIAIAELHILPDETAGGLMDRLAVLAAEMAQEWMPRIAVGNYPRSPQDHDLATHAMKISKEEARFRFDIPTQSLYNRYRAFTPAPGAYFITGDEWVKVKKCRPAAGHGTPGEVLTVDPALTIGTADGALELVELQPSGRKAMSGSEWAHGCRLKTGDVIMSN